MAAKRRIAIDIRHLHSGIGTYALNVLIHAKSLTENFEVVALTQKKYEAQVNDIRWCRLRMVSAPLHSLRSHLLISATAFDCHLLHMTNYDVPLLRFDKTVITLHDLTHLDRAFVPSATALLYAKYMLRAAARKASHIMTVSEFSKQQIVERLNVPADKITVAHCGVSSHFSPRNPHEAADTVAAILGIEKPYLLYISNLKPHKNLITLLEACAILRGQLGPSYRLVIVGDDKIGAQQSRADAIRLGVDSFITWLPCVKYEVLPHLYSAAEAFVFPSLAEGFGLPVLEAMACGAPVVCSRAASLPEVAGEAAAYFDPLSPSELAIVLDKVLSNTEIRERMRKAGLTRSLGFNWQHCADKHVQVYREILNH